MTVGLRRIGLCVAAIAGPWAAAGPMQAQAIHPQWSPTGAWIAYYQRTGASPDLAIAGPDY